MILVRKTKKTTIANLMQKDFVKRKVGAGSNITQKTKKVCVILLWKIKNAKEKIVSLDIIN